MPQNFKDNKIIETDISTETLFKNTGVEIEEINLPSSNTDIESEVLFKSEQTEIVKLKLVEESLDFVEPVKPVLINEEVLFTEPVLEPEIENFVQSESLISDNLINDLAVALNEDSINLNDSTKQKVVKIPFSEKMFLADPIVLERYNEIKNFMLTFKEVKSRISNTCDTFNIGRLKLIKLAVSGKSLKLYLNLDYNEVETRLKCKDASSKKAYSQVPVFLRIRSPRSMRNAKYLLNQLVEKHDLKKRKKTTSIDAPALLKAKLEN